MNGTVFFSRVTAAVALCSPILLLFGCGEKGPERVVVRGTVTYEGKPIKLGAIRFVPQEGSGAPSSGGHIIDGRYEVKHRGGVPVGHHRVEIEAYRPIAASKDAPAADALREQYLPEKFHRESTMTIDVPTGAKEIERDFDL